MVLIREGPEILQYLVLAPGLFRLLLEPDDPAVLVGLRRSVAGKGGFRHLVVFGGPSSQGRILDAELFGEALRRHLSREHDFGCRDLKLPVVAFPSSGHIEHLSPLTRCPIYLTLSTDTPHRRSEKSSAPPKSGFDVSSRVSKVTSAAYDRSVYPSERDRRRCPDLCHVEVATSLPHFAQRPSMSTQPWRMCSVYPGANSATPQLRQWRL